MKKVSTILITILSKDLSQSPKTQRSEVSEKKRETHTDHSISKYFDISFTRLYYDSRTIKKKG